MNLVHLGDALDHWKGSILRVVQSRNLKVVPMFTGRRRWSARALKEYAKLLGVRRSQILHQESLFNHAKRCEYFCDRSLRGDFDLLIDPDTGIAPKHSGDKYIELDDVECLLRGNRLLMIYQHSQPYKMRKSLNARLPKIKARKWPYFAYWAGSVSMVFVSKRPVRIRRARASFENLLAYSGRRAKNCRILPSP